MRQSSSSRYRTRDTYAQLAISSRQLNQTDLYLAKMWPLYVAAILAIVHCTNAQIDRTSWTVTADSFQTGTGNEPIKAIDADRASIFHTQWMPVNVPLPHNLTIDMKASYNINAVSYLPRQDGTLNGNIGQHEIRLSADGTTWGAPVVCTIPDYSDSCLNT